MCMSAVRKGPERLRTYKARKGWKVFRLGADGQLVWPYYWPQGRSYVELNVWMEDLAEYKVSVWEKGRKTARHLTGFHIFLRKPTKQETDNYFGTVDKYIVCEVEFERPVVTGLQDKIPTVVARLLKVKYDPQPATPA